MKMKSKSNLGVFLNNHVRKLLNTFIENRNYVLSVVIDDYQNQIKNYYAQFVEGNLTELCKIAKIPYAFGFHRFGLIVEFSQELIVKIHDENMQLNSEVKSLVRQFGVVIFRNADLPQSIKYMHHKNNFPHLNFHTDRNDNQENRYSLYTRDPYDLEQKFPRKASTLFIDNAVAYLQAIVEQQFKADEIGRRGHYNLFESCEINELFNSLVLEQAWNAPIGTGEICIINNNCVLHSSYKHGFEKGYYISARYLF